MVKIQEVLYLCLCSVSWAASVASSSGNSDGNAQNQGTWVTAPGNFPQKPSQDPDFYVTDYSLLELNSYRNGDILQQRAVNSGAYPNTQGYEVVFRTSHFDGSPTIGVTTILIPDTLGDQKIVSYQYSEDAADLDCSPSYTLLTSQALPQVELLLAQGWAVNFPDYLGNSSAFTAGLVEGQHVLDAQRALLRLNPTGNRTWDISLWGYGGGSLATGWAAELHDTYAPDIKISSVAVGGFVTSIINWLENLNESTYSGYIAASLLGMSKEYPNFNSALYRAVIPEKRNAFLEAQSLCVQDYEVRFLNENIYTYFINSENIFNDPVIESTYRDNSLGNVAPTIPILVYQGANDEVVPIQDVDRIVEFYCQGGTPLEYQRYSNVGHSVTEAAARENVVEYISNGFNGHFNKFCGSHGQSDSKSKSFPGIPVPNSIVAPSSTPDWYASVPPATPTPEPSVTSFTTASVEIPDSTTEDWSALWSFSIPTLASPTFQTIYATTRQYSFGAVTHTYRIPPPGDVPTDPYSEPYPPGPTEYSPDPTEPYAVPLPSN